VTPTTVERDAQFVIGLVTRTTNAAESTPATARLGRLWQRVLSEHVIERVPRPTDPMALHAVLTDYESDARGEYTQVVGVVAAAPDQLPSGLVAVAIPAGRYMLFTAHGRMPDALITTWQTIWDYFAGRAPVERAYTTDYEVHRGSTNPEASVVEVYVAIR